MIAQISHTGNTAGVVSYHDKKMELGVATIIDSYNVNTKTRNNIQASFNSYNIFASDEKPTVHISINFHADDRSVLTDSLYKEITNEYLTKMGYAEQPFIVYKHKDQAHPHIHIITTKIKDNGNKIPTWGERYRSQNISRNIELSYNLTQVSSLKNNNKTARSLSNEKEYLTYIRSSVKEAMSLRPKRNIDLINVLSLRYGIDLYNSKNGVGFALLGEHHNRYKNGYGTKGIAASKIDKNWSKSKLNKTLSDNFDNAPKRYRNLKATEKLIKYDFAFFNSISTIDFNTLFEQKGASIYSEKSTHIIVDSKGKNVYSERDLKGVDFSLISKTTNLKNTNSSGLFKLIADESLLAYKNEYSKKLLLSSFIRDIAVKETFLDTYNLSDTYNRFSPLLSESNLGNLHTYLNSYFDNIDSQLKDIVKKEEFSFEQYGTIIKQFSSLTGLEAVALKNDFRLNIYKENYTLSSSERGVLALMEKVIGPQTRFTDDKNIYSGLIFETHKFLDIEKLPEEVKKETNKILVEKYIKATINEAKRELTTPENFVRNLNTKGILLHRSVDGKLIGSIPSFEYQYTLKGVENFVSKIDFKDNFVTANFDDIRFNKAFEKEQYGYAFSLLIKDKLSPELFDKFKDVEQFKAHYIDKENRETISSELYNFKSSKEIIYTSDFKAYLINNPDEFITHIHTTTEISLESVKEYLDSYTSWESINESTRTEKEYFHNTIQLSNKLGNGELSALLGLRTTEPGVILDTHGKYSVNGNISYSESIKRLQEQPYFNYYSSVFNEVSFHLYGDKRETFKLDYSHLLVYESFKNHIPDSFRKDYQRTFEESYVLHFTNKIFSNEKDLSDTDKVDYLNSKGIRVIEKDNSIYFKLGGSDKLIKPVFEPNLSKFSSDNQINYLRSQGFSAPGTRRTDQLRFVVAMEKENYTESAWLLKQNKVTLSLTGLEPEKLKGLQNELEKLDLKPNNEILKSIDKIFKQDEYLDGHYGGGKSNKNKRKNKPRLQ